MTNGLPRYDSHTMDADRRDVYAAIETEVESADSAQTVGEFILMLGEHADRARRKWAERGDAGGESQESLNEVRKIAALAVRCMVQHGVPKRASARIIPKPEAAAQGSGSDW